MTKYILIILFILCSACADQDHFESRVWLEEICIDGVVYVVRSGSVTSSHMSVKFNKDSAVELCKVEVVE